MRSAKPERDQRDQDAQDADTSQAPGDRATTPVLIIGTERSGSNLLRLVLNAHSQIAVPHPPHFMRYLTPVVDAYGDLRSQEHRRALARDALLLLRHHIHPWEHPVDEERVVASAAPSLFGVVASIYEEFRRGEGKPQWGCKSTFMVDHVDEVMEVYPEARFVWLVRDPRDVAASGKRSIFGPCHPYLTVRLWRRQQLRAVAALDHLGPRHVHLMRYEDLVSRPEAAVDQLCGFLGVGFEETMTAPHRTASAQRTAKLAGSWRNVGQPISSSRVGAHADELSSAERRQVEAVAGELLNRLGYTTEQAGDAVAVVVPRPSMARVHVLNGALRTRVEWASMRHDANHRRRVRRDLTVRWIRLRAHLRRARRSRGVRQRSTPATY